MKYWLILAACVVFIGANAWAGKSIALHWKPIKGAIRYEIQIQGKIKKEVREKLTEPEWEGELPFGVYTYQIRAVDKLDRPGLWSTPKSLVVMPKPPEPKSPKDGADVELYNLDAHLSFKWEPTEGASLYKIEIEKEGKPFKNETVSGNEFRTQGFAAGKYTWRVAAVILPDRPVGDSVSDESVQRMSGKKWLSKPSSRQELKVIQATLAGPTLIFPKGKIGVQEDGKLTFKWQSVEGAEAYELTLLAEPKGRSPAQVIAEKKIIVRDTQLTTRIPSEGKITWKVRALANYTAPGVAESSGVQSTATAELDRNANFFEGSGYVALSTMFAPYNYKVISQAANISGTASSSQITYRASGEYWVKPQLALAASFDVTSFSVFNQNYYRGDYEVAAKYRGKLDQRKFGWYFSPKVGLEWRDYIELVPAFGNSVPQANQTRFAAVGPSIGLDIRKQLNDRFSLGAKINYFLPVTLTGNVQYEALTVDASYRNISVGVQALYWADHHFGLGLGVFTENRSISFISRTPQAASTRLADQIFSDSLNLFGSVVYSFGH